MYVVGCNDLPAFQWMLCIHVASLRRENFTRRKAPLTAEPYQVCSQAALLHNHNTTLTMNSNSKNADEKMNSKVHVYYFFICLGHEHA